MIFDSAQPLILRSSARRILLTTSASPAGAGTVTPASGNYYAANSSVTLTATANSGYAYANWSGPVNNGTAASTKIVMSSPESVVANFETSVLAITVSSTQLNFGNVSLNSSPNLKVTVENTGTGAAGIDEADAGDIERRGAAGNDFSFTSQCTAAVKPGKTCTITVSLKAVDAGSGQATLNIASNAPGGPIKVPIAANVLNPKATLSKSSQNLGTVTVGSSATASLTLTSSGLTPLLISEIYIPGSTDFTQTNNCPASLDPNLACTITVQYAPSAKGTESAMLNVSDNASSKPQTVSLSGKGD